MLAQETFGTVALVRSAAYSANFFHFQVAKYPMMAVPAVARCEQAEEKKYIADADTVPFSDAIAPHPSPESPPAVQEYGVFVAELVGTDTPLGHLLDNLSKPCKTIVRLERRSVGIGRLIGSPLMIGEGNLPAALSKPFLLKLLSWSVAVALGVVKTPYHHSVSRQLPVGRLAARGPLNLILNDCLPLAPGAGKGKGRAGQRCRLFTSCPITATTEGVARQNHRGIAASLAPPL